MKWILLPLVLLAGCVSIGCAPRKVVCTPEGPYGRVMTQTARGSGKPVGQKFGRLVLCDDATWTVEP